MLACLITLQVLVNPTTDMQEGSAISLEDLQDQGVRPYDEKARGCAMPNKHQRTWHGGQHCSLFTGACTRCVYN